MAAKTEKGYSKIIANKTESADDCGHRNANLVIKKSLQIG